MIHGDTTTSLTALDSVPGYRDACRVPATEEQQMSRRGWRRFDRGMREFNRAFDRTLNHVVRPRPRLNRGASFFDLFFREVNRPSSRRRW